MKHPVAQGLGFLCSLLVLLAGLLAANPEWHQALHVCSERASDGNAHPHDGQAPGHGDESSCAICAFAHQQVHSGLTSPVAVLMLVERICLCRCASSSWLQDTIWPEPSGRGPPPAV